MPSVRTPFWTRVVADQEFRAAIIEDPLRALAGVDDVDVSAQQVRQLEDISREDRVELVTQVVRDAHIMGAYSRFGPLRDDAAPGPIDEPPSPG